MQDEVGQLQEKLADAKARQKSMLMRQQTVASRLEVKKTLDSNRLNDAMYKFERYEQKIDSLEAQVESYDLGKKTFVMNLLSWQPRIKLILNWQH